MRRVIAIVGSPNLIDSDIVEGLEELTSTDRIWFGQSDEWVAHYAIWRPVRDHMALRDERVHSVQATPVPDATDLWAIWDGCSVECLDAIRHASEAGLRVRVHVLPVGRRCARTKTSEEVARG